MRPFGPLGALVVVALLSGRVAAQPEGEGPAATWLREITWTHGGSVTRVRFQAGRAVSPDVVRPSPGMLRIDLTAVGAGQTPARCLIESEQVASLWRVPESQRGSLPAGVSERFLLRLAREDVDFRVEPLEDGFVLHVGEQGVVRVPAAPAAGDSLLDLAAAEALGEPPLPGERLDPGRPFRVAGDLPVRSAPSPLAPEQGRVAAGQTRIADARRGDWVHLLGGGWLRHDLAVQRASAQRRSPAEWSTETLAGFALDLREVAPGEDASADRLAQLFVTPSRLLALSVRVSPSSNYGVRLPQKPGRLVLVMADGRRVESYDALSLPLRDPREKPLVERELAAPEVHPGESWATALLVPADVDPAAAQEAWLDVGGRATQLFRVPGTGEPVGE